MTLHTGAFSRARARWLFFTVGVVALLAALAAGCANDTPGGPDGSSGGTAAAGGSPALYRMANDDGLYGYVDFTGAFVIEPQFKYAQPFSEGFAAVPDRRQPLGLCRRDGGHGHTAGLSGGRTVLRGQGACGGHQREHPDSALRLYRRQGRMGHPAGVRHGAAVLRGHGARVRRLGWLLGLRQR